MSVIFLLLLCVPLMGVLLLAAGIYLFWQEHENRVLAGIFVAVGVLILIASLVGMGLLFGFAFSP